MWRYRDWPGSQAGETAAEKLLLWMSEPPWSRTSRGTSEPGLAESTPQSVCLSVHTVSLCVGIFAWGKGVSNTGVKVWSALMRTLALFTLACTTTKDNPFRLVCFFDVFASICGFFLLANRREDGKNAKTLIYECMFNLLYMKLKLCRDDLYRTVRYTDHMDFCSPTAQKAQLCKWMPVQMPKVK